MKTPEEMAKEYLDNDDVACSAIDHAAEHLVTAAFLAGYQAAQDQLADADKVMPQWISVKYRLPEEGEDVLVFGQYLNDIPKVLGVRARYRGDQEWNYTWEGSDEWIYRENDVTHWMPLPAPPKEEG